MTGHPVSSVETLDSVVGDADIELLLDQGIRHRVVMFFDLHVVVDVNPRLLSLGIDVGLCWLHIKYVFAVVGLCSAIVERQPQLKAYGA